MTVPPKDDQLALFPGMIPAEAVSPIRPWRTALADQWRAGVILGDQLEPFHVDLLRRNRELLRALKLASVPEDLLDVQRFRQSEAPLIHHWVLLRRGEITEDAESDVARAALETADELAGIRRQILEGLAPDSRERVLKAEPRVSVHDFDFNRELAAIELAVAEEKGELVEISLPMIQDEELPPGFLGPADIEALMQGSLRAWKAEQDQRPLPPRLGLATLLKGIPSIWLDAVCQALDIEPQKLRLRKDREHAVAEWLSDESRLRSLVRDKLQARERELLAYLLEKGGQLSSSLFTRRFGRDDEDSWFWNEEPPQSLLGRVRLHGLAFVGRLPTSGRRVRTVAIPRDLRAPLRAALEPTMASG